MRESVFKLVEFGKLSSEQEISAEQIAQMETWAQDLTKPASDEEAIALVQIFGEDEMFGFAYALIHFIESAPSWPIVEALKRVENPWVRHLIQRAENAGYSFSE